MTGPVPGKSQTSDAVDVIRARDASSYDADRQSGRDRHDQLLAAFEELTAAEEELRAQQELLLETHNLLEVQRNRYRTLFDHAPDPYLVTDGSGIIEEVNAAAADMFGMAGKLLVGKPLAAYVDPRSRTEFRTHLNSLASGAPIDKWTVDARMRDGRAVLVEATVSALEMRSDGKRSLCWLLRDMTARRDTEDSMNALNRSLNARVAQRTRELELALKGEQAARREAEAANRIKSELFARLSHEFRTPLHAVSGYLEILQQNIHGNLNHDQQRDVQRIHQAQEHLLTLVNMILDFAKLEGGPIELSMAEIPVEETLRGAEALVAPQFAKKGVGYRHHNGDDAVTVFADREKVQQILVNLLANAVKFTSPGGNVDLEWRLEEPNLVVRVRDTGCGIEADKIEQIFEPFVQLRAPGSVPTGGTGLGLAISRDLARAMGGDVTASSTRGVGSVFTLTLPIRKRPGGAKLSGVNTGG
ncbi:MAG TPA: ATP-binding protein [Gemmatimonadaceae bacterium]